VGRSSRSTRRPSRPPYAVPPRFSHHHLAPGQPVAVAGWSRFADILQRLLIGQLPVVDGRDVLR